MYDNRVRFLLMAALIVIQHCYVHTERSTQWPEPGGPGDLYQYKDAGQVKTCGVIHRPRQAGVWTWEAENYPNKLGRSFKSYHEAKEWLGTLCVVMK
jgi:hypothetical protein